MASSDLLSCALHEAPVAVVVVTLDGFVEEMNHVWNSWFDNVLKRGDQVSRKLNNISNEPLQLKKNGKGHFLFADGVFLYECGSFYHKAGKREYLSVFVFNNTEDYQKLTRAETVAQLHEGVPSFKNTSTTLTAADNTDNTAAEDMDAVEDPSSLSLLTAFENSCSLHAGLCFTDDPNSYMIRYSPTGIIVECNKTARGFTREEIIGRQSYEHMHPDDVQKVGNFHQALLDDPRPTVPAYLWVRKLHKNGYYVHTEFIGAYHSDEQEQRWITGKVLSRVLVYKKYRQRIP
jgi:PAS domain S-box-containing protein